MMSTEKQKRVYWNDFDRSALIEEGLVVRREHPDLGLLGVFHKAQERAIQSRQLGHDKKRNVNTITMVPWFKKAIHERVKEGPRAPEPVKVEKKISDFTTEEIMTELIARLIRPVVYDTMTRVAPELVGQIAAVMRSQSQASVMARLHRKKLVVVGLKDGLWRGVEDKFPNVDFKFAPPDGGLNLREKVKGADATLVMVRFTSHSAQDMIKAEGVIPIYVDGCVSNLEEKVKDVLAGALA